MSSIPRSNGSGAGAMGATNPEQRYAALLRELVALEDEIARRYRLLAEVQLDAPVDPALPDEYRALVRDIRSQAELDRRENILFQLWMKERLTRGPLDLELEEFSEVVAGRALIRLLHYVPKGRELLATLGPKDEDWLPDPRDVRSFVVRGGLAEKDPEKFLARLFREVPRSRRALYRILGAYKVAVELAGEKERPPLPGEDLKTQVSWDLLVRLLGPSPRPWEEELARARRFVAAVEAYTAGASYREAAKLAGEARERFRQRLVELGVLRHPGRPKGKGMSDAG